MSLSPKHIAASLEPEERARWLAEQPPWVIQDILRGEWWWNARPEQRTPPGAWFVWLLLTGRGWGKTQTGGEWMTSRMINHPVDRVGRPTEHLIVAETMSDARALCVEGPAGMRRVLERCLGPERRNQHDNTGKWKLWKSPKPFFEIFETGVRCYTEGADDADVGRGYNLTSAWLDEYAKWPNPDGSWSEGIMPSLRADIPGDHPRAMVTTTPKPVVQLVEWRARTDGSVYLTTGSTFDNAINLAASVVAELYRRYHGTRLGRQELYGELIEQQEGALWEYEWLERSRVHHAPSLERIVVGMDPAGTGEKDLTGLVAVGHGTDGDDYVLGDWSKQVAGHAACRRAWEMVQAFGANQLIVEKNQGQRYLIEMLEAAYVEMQAEGLFPPGGSAPIKAITAKIGKAARAEPVAARYEQGRIHHVTPPSESVNRLAALETQLVSWVPRETPESPDRLDANVYACLYVAERAPVTAAVARPFDRQLVGYGDGMGPLATAGSGPYG